MKKNIFITVVGILFIVWAVSSFLTVSFMKLENLGINIGYLTGADESLFMILGIIFSLWLFVIGIGILRREWVIYRLLMIFIGLWNLVNVISLFMTIISKDYASIKYILVSSVLALVMLAFFAGKKIREEFNSNS